MLLGTPDGILEGLLDGNVDGTNVGIELGLAVGTDEGKLLGNELGTLVGNADGTTVGEHKIFTNKNAGAATITPANFGPGTSIALNNNQGCHMIWDGGNWQLIGNNGGTVS